MYQLFYVHLLTGTEYQIFRAAKHDDRTQDVLLAKTTLHADWRTKWGYQVDVQSAMNPEEVDSIDMLVDVALENAEEGVVGGFIFEVSI